jgi:glutamyl/glutaminyl-tRNA synthetase
LRIYKERLETIKDVEAFCAYFFVAPVVGADANKFHNKMWKSNSGNTQIFFKSFMLIGLSAERIAILVDKIGGIPSEDFTSNNISDVLTTISKSLNCSMGELYNPIRYLVSGLNIGAPIPATMALLGKDVVISRLNKYKELYSICNI